MSTVTRRYKLAGPQADCLTAHVGNEAAPKAHYLGTIVDVELNDAVGGATDCLDEFMCEHGYVFDDAAKPIAGGRSRWTAGDAVLPSSNPAQLTSRNDHAVLAFDDSTAESVIFEGIMPEGYTAEALEVLLFWVAATATSNTVRWGAEWERDNSGGHDIDSDSFSAQQTVDSDAPGTCGQIRSATIEFTQAQADSVAAGEPFRLRIQRAAAAAEDTMVGDAQLLRVAVREK